MSYTTLKEIYRLLDDGYKIFSCYSPTPAFTINKFTIRESQFARLLKNKKIKGMNDGFFGIDQTFQVNK